MSSEIFVQHTWLGALVWQSTLCLVAGLGGSFLLRRHAVRAHQVLLLGLIAAVLIPALSHLVKRNQWGLLVAERAVATREHRPTVAPADAATAESTLATELPPAPGPVPIARMAPSPTPVSFAWRQAVLPAWLVVSSILLLRLALQFLRGWHLANRSEAVDDVQLLRGIEAAKDRVGLKAEVRLRASTHAGSPVIWGWGRRPVLLIPPASQSDESLDWPSILCHELAHAKRHDHVSGLFAELLLCVLPWQPLLWWARQRLAALSEEACDDWVIASGQRATRYAKTLLCLTPQGRAALLPAVVTSKTGLAARVRRIIDDRCGNPHAGVRWSLTAVALAAGTALGVGFAQTRPATPASTGAKASQDRVNQILDAMRYHDRAVLPIALHTEVELHNLDAPADLQHDETYAFEQRLDGKRLDSRMKRYRLRDGQFQCEQVHRYVCTGAQCLYRQQAVGPGPNPLTAVLYPQSAAPFLTAYDFMWGCTLLGHLGGDEKPVADLLRDAADLTLHERRQDVDGFACQVIEGKTNHGTYQLWVDPEHSFRIRRAVIDKGIGDLYYGLPLARDTQRGGPDRTVASIHWEISGVKLEKFGAHFIATTETVTTTRRMISGRESHSKMVVKRAQIDLSPDFEKLGAFVMDGIPEGTPLTNHDPNDHTYAYEWRNGQATSIAPNGGILVGRLKVAGREDLDATASPRRNLRAKFTPEATTPEGLEGRRTHDLELTLGKDGAFQVKDIPPGMYLLHLMLMETGLVELPGGGLGTRGSIRGQADLEFSIPEAKEARQEIVDLGVIDMSLPGTVGSAGGSDAGKDVGTAQRTSAGPARSAEPQPAPPASPQEKAAVGKDETALLLVDPEGRPVAGAIVDQYVRTLDEPVLGRRLRASPQSRVSDEYGRAIVQKSPAAGDTRGFCIFHEERHLVAFQEVSAQDLGKEIQVKLEPACRLHARFASTGLQQIGWPLVWTNVYLHWHDHRPLSHDSERQQMEFWVPPGEYRLSAYGAGHKGTGERQEFSANTETETMTVTVNRGQAELDLGVIDLKPDRIAALIGKPAPAFQNIKAWKNGGPVTWADLRGRFVILDFWGHWCGPCVRAMPQLMELHELFGNQGLVVIAVHDASAASLEEMDAKTQRARERYWGGRDLPFLVALDGEGRTSGPPADWQGHGATTDAYGARSFPTTILVDREGKVCGEINVYAAKETMVRLLGVSLPAPGAEPWRKQFNAVYRLEEGEVLKRIAPPFIPERMDYYRTEVRHQAELIPEGPHQMTFHWNGQLENWGMSFGSGIDTLASVLRDVLQLRSYEYDAPKELLAIGLPGDWVIRPEASQEAKLQALQELVARELGRQIRFEKRSVVRDVLVATGRFRFHPPVGTYENTSVHFYATEKDENEGSGGGTAESLSDFLCRLGDLAGMPVLDQTQPSEPMPIPFRHHRSAYMLRIPDPQERAKQLRVMLDHLTPQTELQFQIRQEPVAVWFVTE